MITKDQLKTAHFSLKECTHTDTGLNNELPELLYDNMLFSMQQLELIRIIWGNKPIKINRLFSTEEVNSTVGGVKNSQHCLALAADCTCTESGTPEELVRTIIKSKLPFDQLILEQTWVHISFQKPNRNEILDYRNGQHKQFF